MTKSLPPLLHKLPIGTGQVFFYYHASMGLSPLHSFSLDLPLLWIPAAVLSSILLFQLSCSRSPQPPCYLSHFLCPPVQAHPLSALEFCKAQSWILLLYKPGLERIHVHCKVFGGLPDQGGYRSAYYKKATESSSRTKMDAVPISSPRHRASTKLTKAVSVL